MVRRPTMPVMNYSVKPSHQCCAGVIGLVRAITAALRSDQSAFGIPKRAEIASRAQHWAEQELDKGHTSCFSSQSVWMVYVAMKIPRKMMFRPHSDVSLV